MNVCLRLWASLFPWVLTVVKANLLRHWKLKFLHLPGLFPDWASLLLIFVLISWKIKQSECEIACFGRGCPKRNKFALLKFIAYGFPCSCRQVALACFIHIFCFKKLIQKQGLFLIFSINFLHWKGQVFQMTGVWKQQNKKKINPSSCYLELHARLLHILEVQG